MKYWVYKDSRILGPFDKNSVAGLPGLDASTLVCAGESAAAGEGDWRPAGDISDLAALPLDRGAAWPIDDMSSTYGLLDKLQLETAGLIGDDEFPGAAHELFQDADMKAAFGDLLAPHSGVDEAELRRAKDRASELTVQLEMLYKRVAELEAGQTNLVHRLAEKELQLRSRFAGGAAPEAAPEIPPGPVPLSSAPPPAALSPAPPPLASAAPPPVAPPPAPAGADWQSPAGAGAFPSFPAFGSTASTPPPAPPAPSLFAPPAAVPPAAPPPASPAAPPIAPLAPSKPAPLDWAGPPPVAPSAAPAVPPFAFPDAAPATDAPPAPAPKKGLFEKKTFKTVPTVKSFRVVGPEEKAGTGAPPPSVSPPAAAASPAPAMPPFPAAPAPAMPSFAAAPTPAPISLEPLIPPPPPPSPILTSAPEPFAASAPPLTAPPVPEFEAMTQAAPAPALSPFSPPTPAPSSMPPATLSFGAPPTAEPPAEMPSFSSPLGNDMSGAPSTEEALARLAKPAPAPATKAPRPPRSNKPFLIGAAVLVILMAVVGAILLRHPKDLNKDLKQMTELDDGRARLGAEPAADDPARPPLIKPKMAAPPAELGAAPAVPAAEAARAASQAKIDAAVAAVKDFPLDGDRGTVAQWLQFSYTASPDAGKETWSASETGPDTYLVEYRYTPASRGDEVHYLFEVDMGRGFVIGKNLDAKSVLAGGPRVSAEKAKPKAKPRKPARSKKAPRAARRAAEDVTPKEVPLLPLPNEGELRPPAEDDGAFNSDTVNSGL